MQYKSLDSYFEDYMSVKEYRHKMKKRRLAKMIVGGMLIASAYIGSDYITQDHMDKAEQLLKDTYKTAIGYVQL